MTPMTHIQTCFYPKIQLVIIIWKKHLIKEKPHLRLHQPYEWSTGLHPETMPPSSSVYLILSAMEREAMKRDTVWGGSFGKWTPLAITLANCCCLFIKRMLLFRLHWLQGTSWRITPSIYFHHIWISLESYYFLQATPIEHLPPSENMAGKWVINSLQHYWLSSNNWWRILVSNATTVFFCKWCPSV